MILILINHSLPIRQKIGSLNIEQYENINKKPQELIIYILLILEKAEQIYYIIGLKIGLFLMLLMNMKYLTKNNEQHINIPIGEYYLKEGIYGNPKKTNIIYNHGKYHHSTIKYLLKMKYITLDDITGIRKCKNYIKNDYFKDLIKHIIKEHPDNYNILICIFVGGLHQPEYKNWGGF